jgi:Sigma-70, region 4
MVHTRLTLERELRELLGTGRNALIAARYYGFDGGGGSTLQAVGNEIGVTRERVRQIVRAVSESLSIRRPVSPTFDRTIAFVADRIPATAGEIEAGLRSQRLTSGLFRLEGVIKAAELLGRRLPFSITEVKGERLVYPRDVPSADTIIGMARRLICRWGMANLSDVVAEARKVECGLCDRKLVASALVRMRGFHWLEESSGWFWLSDTHYNPVLRHMRKVLSVANPINISELWARIGRDPRMRRFSPPRRVLLEFCRQAPGLRVNGETVLAEPEINSDDVLTQTEKDIVRILSEHGGMIATSEFKSVCFRMRVNSRTFYLNLVRSPIISTYGGHVYGLVGSGERSGRSSSFVPEALTGRGPDS